MDLPLVNNEKKICEENNGKNNFKLINISTKMVHEELDETEANTEAWKSQKQSKISSGRRQKASNVIDQSFNAFFHDQRAEIGFFKGEFWLVLDVFLTSKRGLT
jgi:hypothetical protein